MNSLPDPRVFIALPVLDEEESVPGLLQCISSQSYPDIRLYVCVNQPDEWWDDPERRKRCENNLRTLRYLASCRDIPMRIIDRASPGHGWKGKRHGVGWARKTVMDAVSQDARDDDLIVSMDADTTFPPEYILSLVENFREHPEAVAASVPYFHRLPGGPEAARAILRYEIYMRYYLLNLFRIGSPFSFTALGSAIALPARSYRLIGGMAPRMSGEDFYFLQKLRKAGRILCWNREKVYPAARFSDRVFFGTGPAMIKGEKGDWSSYPVYRHTFFNEIKETTDLFPGFMERTVNTAVTAFLSRQFNESDPFRPLRENSREVSQFVRACHEKFDGLRILQYLKYRNEEEGGRDEENLEMFLSDHYPEDKRRLRIDFSRLNFRSSPLEQLESIRMFLAGKEDKARITSILL